MPTQVPPNNHPDHFEKTVIDATKAANALSMSIAQENNVYLSFCENLISNTLQAMSSLNKMEINTARAGIHEQLNQAKQNAEESAEDKKQSVLEASPVHKASSEKPSHEANMNLMGAFVESMSEMMINSVNGQQNLHVVAQAATTQTIEIILSMAPAILAEKVKEFENS